MRDYLFMYLITEISEEYANYAIVNIHMNSKNCIINFLSVQHLNNKEFEKQQKHLLLSQIAINFVD